MLARLFSGAVNDLLGRETLQSKSYDFNYPDVVNYDAAGGQLYLEAIPHIFDKTRYALAETVITRTSRVLTPPDLKKTVETTSTTDHKPLKDKNGKPYSLTRDEALKKIADYEAAREGQGLKPASRPVSALRISPAP